jgi:acyl-CoA dehydrogenase
MVDTLPSTLEQHDEALTGTILRARTRAICERFPDEYWRERDLLREYPHDFVNALTEAGLLGALIPTEYGGLGVGISEAAQILEEINRSGGHAAAIHGQLYTMGAMLRHGSEAQKSKYLPEIAAGRLRLQAFSVTERDAGSETTSIVTKAEKDGDDWVITGHKAWTSRVAETDLMLVLARTEEKPEKKTMGLTLFLVDLREVAKTQPDALEVRKVRTMINYATNEVFYHGLRIPHENVVGEVGHGFRYVLDGLNAERILLAAEAIGDGYWFIDRATSYGNDRVVFGRQITSNQGVQFPIVDAYMKIRAADMMRQEAARLFDAGEACGAEANMGLHLAAEASWEAANVCLDVHGGYGIIDTYDVERKFRETRMYHVAPVNKNMIKSFVGTKVLGMPRTY